MKNCLIKPLELSIQYSRKLLRRNVGKRLQSTQSNVRVRFAPSPTGHLHVGGLRTALYNYLFARQYVGGKFILRIEDTDRSRCVPGAVEKLLTTLHWMGLQIDEGPHNREGNFGPYLQSQRLHLYQKYAADMVKDGKAYYCFCTERRLSLLKQEQQRRREHIRYDNRCRYLTDEVIKRKLQQGTPYVIRFRMDDSMVPVNDLLFGDVKDVVGSVEGDPVLLKSDGYPTYHFANVVDDHLMEISHVIRGKEWLISTGKHLKLYRALGWCPPKFMHLPLLVNENRSKLSKRQGDVFVEQFQARGYTQSSLLNFISSYGAGFSQLQFPVTAARDHHHLLHVLTEHFNPQKLVVTDAFCDFSRLDDYSFELLRHRISNPKERDYLVTEVTDLLKLHRPNSFVLENKSELPTYLSIVLDNMKNRLTTLQGLCCEDEFAYLWIRPDVKLQPDDFVFEKLIQDFTRLLSDTKSDLSDISNFIKKTSKSHKLKYSHCMQFIRYVLIGSRRGAPIAELIETLGLEETLLRLRQALLEFNKHIFTSVS